MMSIDHTCWNMSFAERGPDGKKPSWALGRATLNANKCARILHVWQGFVEEHSSFFVDNFNYKPDGKPGQRGKMFALLRDEILPAGLRFGHVRSEVEVGLSTLQERHVKRIAVRSDGQASVRSIEGWELLRNIIGIDPNATTPTEIMRGTLLLLNYD